MVNAPEAHAITASNANSYTKKSINLCPSPKHTFFYHRTEQYYLSTGDWAITKMHQIADARTIYQHRDSGGKGTGTSGSRITASLRSPFLITSQQNAACAGQAVEKQRADDCCWQTVRENCQMSAQDPSCYTAAAAAASPLYDNESPW